MASDLALVVPCYNEAARLDPAAFLHFLATHPGVQLVMVDDGSEDGTWELLARMREAAPATVTAIHHAVNRGKAEVSEDGKIVTITYRDSPTRKAAKTASKPPAPWPSSIAPSPTSARTRCIRSRRDWRKPSQSS